MQKYNIRSTTIMAIKFNVHSKDKIVKILREKRQGFYKAETREFLIRHSKIQNKVSILRYGDYLTQDKFGRFEVMSAGKFEATYIFNNSMDPS